MQQVRLQKIIADSGLCSRRKAEALIEQGRVKLNGKKATIGQSADPKSDRIEVDGKHVRPAVKEYLVLNKPIRVETTMSDPKGRRTVADFIPGKNRLYPVGRLDYMTEGCLIVTNDGEFANLIMHPRYTIEKEYLGLVDREIKASDAAKIRKGLMLDDGLTSPGEIEITAPENKGFRLTIHEGRNRIVRRIFEKLGYKIRRLVRARVGTVKLGNLLPGQTRRLTKEEINFFRRL